LSLISHLVIAARKRPIPEMTANWNISMRTLLVAFVVALAWASASAADIRVMAAGSLKDAFTAIFADYGKKYGSGFVPVWGPSGVLRERLTNGEEFDVFASAALPHAQALTDAGLAGPSVLFARNALCIVTGADSPLDTGNLIETLLKPEIRIGTSTPVADPAGDYTWEMFHRIDAIKPGAFEVLSKKAKQIFGGPATAGDVNGRPRQLVMLDGRQIDLLVYYCSSTQPIVRDSAKYKSVALPPELSVGPEYGLTVSRKATAGAADFAMYLLSPPGQASLKAFGFIPVALPQGH
jgi:molybdate transport system substrate-binding protein